VATPRGKRARPGILIGIQRSALIGGKQLAAVLGEKSPLRCACSLVICK
jgi:hypothetical protein